MPAIGEDGGVYVMIKDDKGKRNVCVLAPRQKGATKGRGNAYDLTEAGEEWIASEISKGAVIEEIISMLGVSSKTLYARDNGEKVKRAVEKGKDNCNMRLRKAQVNAALNGNTSMLIWLGKNRLGQSDHPEIDEATVSPLEEFAREMRAYQRREEREE